MINTLLRLFVLFAVFVVNIVAVAIIRNFKSVLFFNLYPIGFATVCVQFMCTFFGKSLRSIKSSQSQLVFERKKIVEKRLH